MKKMLFALFCAVIGLTVGGGAQAMTYSPLMREYTMSPGNTITETIRLLNETANEQTYYAVFQDFVAQDESGTPSFLPEGSLAETGSLSSWFQKIEPITLKSHGEMDVLVTIKIPKNAEPGGHYGAVLFTDMKPTNKDVSVASKSGPIFLVNVIGDFKEDFSLVSFSANNSFYSTLPAQFTLRLKNNGTVHETPRGTVIAKGWFGSTQVAFNEKGSSHVLPKSTRKFDITLGAAPLDASFMSKVKSEWENKLIGRYKANLEVKYGLSIDGTLNGVAVFWVIPWHALSVLILALLVVISVFKGYNSMIIRQVKKNK